MTPTRARVVETHISTLFFSAERVYKLAKRVALPFLRTVDVAERLESADREFELNRRFAPDVYLGIADVVEAGQIVDRMIVMRRLPDERRLSTILASRDATSELRAIARRVASAHAAAEQTVGPRDRVDRLSRNWSDNFDAIAPHVGTIIDVDEFKHVKLMAERYVGQSRPLRASRLASGFVRDGHGDLTADDIFCLDDGPRILDCLAFDDGLRIDDVLDDIAFLAMDVQRIAGAQAARTLMDAYHEFSNEHHPPSLAHHYVAYRAHVRAKIACLRIEQGDLAATPLARTLHALALEHLERAQLRVILVGGGPGVGKTTLSAHLADRLGYVHLATDEIRHDVAGVARSARLAAPVDQGAYEPAVVDATYDAQRRESRSLVGAGYGVVLDASWSSERHRDGIRRDCRGLGVDVSEIVCVLDPDTARARVAHRLEHDNDPSDVSPAMVDVLRSRRDPWPSAHPIETDAPIGNVVTQAIEFLRRRS